MDAAGAVFTDTRRFRQFLHRGLPDRFYGPEMPEEGARP